MRNYGKLFATLSTGTLMGCTQLSMLLSQGDPAALPAKGQATLVHASKPAQGLAAPASEVEALFLQGRSAHGVGELTHAEELYGKVLEKNSAHLGALNSMAVIYAQTDRLDKAIEFFNRALALDPQAAHVHNNLGYAFLLAGRLDESESELQRALDLSPSRSLTLKNMELLAQAQRAALASKPSSKMDFQADRAEQKIVAIAPNVYELQDKRPADPAARAQTGSFSGVAAPNPVSVARSPLPQAQVLNTLAALHGVKIEVSNGVGIRHMARRTAARLAPMGVVTTHLTNQPGFRQSKTEIQFGAGQQEAADALSTKLPVTVKVAPTKGLGKNVQMRLVLGHDLTGKAIAAWLDAAEEPMAIVLNRHDGWLWA